MNVQMLHGLPFVRVSIGHQGQEAVLEPVLIDMGSRGTVFSADRLLTLGVRYEPGDAILEIRGVGGTEFVFSKQIDRVGIDDLRVDGLTVQVGAMNYGMEMDGILGVDFLHQVGAVIDLARLQILPGIRPDP
jgi:aspartyl protease